MTESHRNNSGQRTGPPHILRGRKRRHRFQLQQEDLEDKQNEVCHRHQLDGKAFKLKTIPQNSTAHFRVIKGKAHFSSPQELNGKDLICIQTFHQIWEDLRSANHLVKIFLKLNHKTSRVLECKDVSTHAKNRGTYIYIYIYIYIYNCSYIYLTVILRGRAGYELIVTNEAVGRVGYYQLISGKSEKNNCFSKFSSSPITGNCQYIYFRFIKHTAKTSHDLS